MAIDFASFSFSTANFIDVWDVVAQTVPFSIPSTELYRSSAAESQGLVIFICYQVFSRSLTRLMERTPVSFNVFKALTLRDVAPISSICTLLRHFLERSTLPVKIHMIWMIMDLIVW
jgi:hypothetical protein